MRFLATRADGIIGDPRTRQFELLGRILSRDDSSFSANM
jgi:hypothetical protein